MPYRALHRFCVDRCGFGRTASTVRVADGEPGAECQLGFGYLGLLADPVSGRLLDTGLPWTKMRQVYRLLGLVRRYGPGPVDAACGRALEVDVVSVTKIASMLEKATENTPPPPVPAAAATGRFTRDPAEYRPRAAS